MDPLQRNQENLVVGNALASAFDSVALSVTVKKEGMHHELKFLNLTLRSQPVTHLI